MKNTNLLRLMALPVAAGLLISACGGAATPTAAPAKPTSAPAAATAAPAAPKPTDAPKPAAPAGGVLFLSTQGNTVEESEKIRNNVLKTFATKVEFVGAAAGPFVDQITAEAKANKGQVDVAGGLVGDLSPLAAAGYFKDLTAMQDKLKTLGIPESFWSISKLGTDKVRMVPWMQATLVMAVNKKALQYLPAGADVNNLTYDQFLAWGKAMKDATKEGKIGFAAGNNGLIHRFFQGYLLPSYTGGVVSTFANADAAKAWTYFADLWQYVNAQSTTYNFMQDPLLTEEVWVAIDHVARLKNAFEQKPADFVAAPAPSGPKGRGYMVILAGLSIPSTAPNGAAAEQLIEHLVKPETQAETLRQIGFYPLLAGDVAGLNDGLKGINAGVKTQAGLKDAIPTLIPQGLGAKGGDFNTVFRNTFTRVVLNKEDVNKVLAEQKTALQTVMNDAKAPCWAPDPDSKGEPCKVN